jgi:hypothetical protein
MKDEGCEVHAGTVRPKFWLAVLLMSLVLSACDVPMLPTTTPLPTATESGTATASSALVVYGVSGGIAGFRRVLTISEEGDARLTDKGVDLAVRELDAATVTRLRDLFKAAGFFELKDQYDQGNVADDIYKTITYTEGGRSKIVMVASEGGKGITPPALQTLVAALDEVERAVEEGTEPALPRP